MWRESARISDYDIDYWEIECEKNIIIIFPEYLKSDKASRFIELVEEDYFSGKKMKFFCFEQEKDDDTIYLSWVEEIREKKGDGNLPQPQSRHKESLVENEIKNEEGEGEDEKSEFNESKEQNKKELFEKIKKLQGEIIILKRKIEEKNLSKEDTNQLRQELNQKEQELEKEKLRLNQEQLSVKIN